MTLLAVSGGSRFRALDGCRGVFALMVALMHLHAAGHFFDWGVVRQSYLAVDFFFVLSGLVIAHASFDKLSSRGDLKRFVIRRFARVWPLHALLLVCFVGFELTKLALWLRGMRGESPPFARGTEYDPLAIPAHLLLVQSLGVFARSTWNVPSWSISAEFYTYLVFALTVHWVRRWERAALAFAAFGATFLFLRAANIDVTYDYGFQRCLYGFFTGVLVFRAHRALPRLPARWGTACEVLCLGAVLSFLELAGSGRGSLLAPLLFAVPIWVFAQERGALSAALKRPLMQALGRWSYAIYMVHEFLFQLTYRVAHLLERQLGVPMFVARGMSPEGVPWKALAFGGAWEMDAFSIVLLGLVVVMGALAHHYVELPGQRFFQRFALAQPWTNENLGSGIRRAAAMASRTPAQVHVEPFGAASERGSNATGFSVSSQAAIASGTQGQPQKLNAKNS